MSTFRKVELSISRAGGYGSYHVHAMYKGKQIKAHTHDSEIYDWLDDDNDKQLHQEAKRKAYGLIVRTYENLHV